MWHFISSSDINIFLVFGDDAGYVDLLSFFANFAGIKLQGLEPDHSYTSSAELRMPGAVPPLRLMYSCHGIIKHREHIFCEILALKRVGIIIYSQKMGSFEAKRH
jgi:hypothetical protein